MSTKRSRNMNKIILALAATAGATASGRGSGSAAADHIAVVNNAASSNIVKARPHADDDDGNIRNISSRQRKLRNRPEREVHITGSAFHTTANNVHGGKHHQVDTSADREVEMFVSDVHEGEEIASESEEIDSDVMLSTTEATHMAVSTTAAAIEEEEEVEEEETEVTITSSTAASSAESEEDHVENEEDDHDESEDESSTDQRKGGKSGKSTKSSKASGKYSAGEKSEDHSEEEEASAEEATSEEEIYDYDDDTFTWDNSEENEQEADEDAGHSQDESDSKKEHHSNEGKSGKSSSKGGKSTVHSTSSDSWNHDNDHAPSSSGKPTHKAVSHHEDDTQGSWSNDDTNEEGHHSSTDSKVSKLFKTKTHKSSKTSKSSSHSSSWDPSWPKPPYPATSKPTKLPTSTITPSTSSPTQDTVPTPVPSLQELPALTWKGVNGCTPTSPCSICQGDCDIASDCAQGLECFARNDSSAVPGCKSGGVGDVPGADYCYDPSLVVGTVSPTSSPSGLGSMQTMSPSSYRPTSDSSPKFPTYAPTPGDTAPSTLLPPVPLPSLTWKGVNGCTPTQPCEVCQGDCDDDSDCFSTSTEVQVACFKRADGETNQVPGCAVGGEGDVPGADYCYDVNFVGAPSSKPTSASSGTYSPSPAPQGQTMSPTRGELKTLSPTKGKEEEAYFIGSQARGGISSSSRHLQDMTVVDWCASGALSPDYYQLLLEECTPDVSSSSSSVTSDSNSSASTNENSVISRMEQMDQLWYLDAMGYVHSTFDYDRCMMVPSTAIPSSDVSGVNEAPVEIGPCTDSLALNQFYYDDSSGKPNMLKLQGYDTLCVTFLGGEVASKGAPMILSQCNSQTKFGWDFILESDLGKDAPTSVPTPSGPDLPRLRYLGRDGCTPEEPCPTCAGDCDTDDDCTTGLECFQRERGDSTQVPGCGVGGPGDIPGADYCFDPTLVGGPTLAPAVPVEQPLRWLGAEGCTVDSPCPTCTGDCDEDDDCQGSYECYKRLVGQTTQIPGCAVGGLGDVPGGDYCYDPAAAAASAEDENEAKDPGVSRPLPPSIPGRPTTEPPAFSPPSEPGRPSMPTPDSRPTEPQPLPAVTDPPLGGDPSLAMRSEYPTYSPNTMPIEPTRPVMPSFPTYRPTAKLPNASVSTPSPSVTQTPAGYNDYDWVELPPEIQEAAALLGYDQKLWDTNGSAWSEDYDWHELSPQEKEAATILGYNQLIWDGASTTPTDTVHDTGNTASPVSSPGNVKPQVSSKSSKASSSLATTPSNFAIERTREHADGSTRWEREHPGEKKKKNKASNEHGGSTRWEREHPNDEGAQQ